MRLLMLSLLFAPLAPLLAQEQIQLRRPATPNVSIRVSGAYASLKITGWAHDSVVIMGSIPADARFDPSIDAVGTAPVRGAKFYVEPPKHGGSATATLELFVPAGAMVWSKSANSAITVAGVSGGLDLNIVGGSVTVNSSPREANIESMDGTVVVIGAPSWLRVKTATGNVTVQGSSTDAAVTTVSGVVKVGAGQYERLRIESITGDVTFNGALARGGQAVMDAHSGRIDLFVGASASLDIEASTIAGRVINSVTPRRATPGREGRGEELTLNLGTGDARATLRTFKGDIRIAR